MSTAVVRKACSAHANESGNESENAGASGDRENDYGCKEKSAPALEK